VIVAVVVPLTARVVTVNVALVAPAPTVTLAGTVATDVLLLVKLTAAPPVGAALLSVTIPVDVPPPVTLVGLKLTDDSTTAGGLIVRVAVCGVPLL
jgi:hypothetical protein